MWLVQCLLSTMWGLILNYVLLGRGGGGVGRERDHNIFSVNIKAESGHLTNP